MKRLAARVSKLIKTFWFKIDKVITYKQRLEWQAEQRKAMDRHLVCRLQAPLLRSCIAGASCQADREVYGRTCDKARRAGAICDAQEASPRI